MRLDSTPIEATDADSELLADIIWFIKGRQSAMRDKDERCELDSSHVEALRKFRALFQDMRQMQNKLQEAERLACAAVRRADLAECWLGVSVRKSDALKSRIAKMRSK